MAREIDALTSTTLKHLRDRWWDDSFATFLDETLQPKPGSRILDVGCGAGTAELHSALGRMPGVSLHGVDLLLDRLREARQVTAESDVSVAFVVGSASDLPYADGSFDSAFCVAVLQHVADRSGAVGELARVTRAGGRIVVVEPDNDARYWFSSVASGRQAYDAASRFLARLEGAAGGRTDPVVGPRVPGLFLRNGIQPLALRVFPVAVSRIGDPSPTMWDAREAAATRLVESAADDDTRALGRTYLASLARYRRDAGAQGPAFVEIQNTMLVASIGQRAA